MLGLTNTLSESALDRAFHKVRSELWEVGLLDEGQYLDCAECVPVKQLPWGNDLGYVFDQGTGFLHRLAGFKPGVIYIASNPPNDAFEQRGVLVDVIRHEFAHIWAWLDKDHVDGEWFSEAFGAHYNYSPPARSYFSSNEFVTEYACKSPKEDFAETFMTYLRHRRSLNSFKKRPGVYRKLRAVHRAVRSVAW